MVLLRLFQWVPSRQIPLRRASGVLLLFCLSALLTGCGNRLYAPAPENPVRIYMIDHGRHPSLVLPHEDSGWIRYAHGEWRWYAQLDQGVWRGVQALFWPTRAAIGRQRLPSAPGQPGTSAAIPEGFHNSLPLEVEAGRVRALREQLDSHFQDAEVSVYQPAFNLDFVPYPHPYWFGRGSNRTMAVWLEQLGVEVRGPALFSCWRLAEDGAGRH